MLSSVNVSLHYQTISFILSLNLIKLNEINSKQDLNTFWLDIKKYLVIWTFFFFFSVPINALNVGDESLPPPHQF